MKKIFGSVIRYCFRYRIILSMVIIVGFLWEDVNEHVVPRDPFNVYDYVGFLGLVLVLAGAFLRSWAAGVVRKGKELADTGPYALTRHPLYLGSLLIALGFTFIIWDSENIFVIMALAAFIYVPKILDEERVLRARFQDQYAAYHKKTGLIFPKRIPRLSAPWSFSQWLRNKEYQAFLVSVLALPLLKWLHEVGTEFYGRFH